MAGQVEGKVALVTGGASGIGEAIVELFAREGATVIITDIDELRGPELAKRVTKAGGKAIFLEQDVTSEERWIEIVAEVAKRYGRLDIMVSNAGIGIAVPSIVDMTLSDWRKQNAINLDGVFLSVKHCLPLMRKTGGGSIVMMSSLAGLRGAPGLSAYSLTKGGVRLFAKSIAMECAAAADGIRVNSVHPGIIDTPIWGKIPTGATGAGQNAPIDPEERARIATPLGRAGQAAEIASGVLYLASDASRYVTGSELVIDGGMNAGGVPRRARDAQGRVAVAGADAQAQPLYNAGTSRPTKVSSAMAHSLHSSSSSAPFRSNRPDLATDAIRTAREDLAACFRMAARNGFEEGICNHFSAVVPGQDDLFLVNPYGYAFRELTASKLLICDFHGNVLDGEGVPEATAFYIHAEMHRLLPRAKVAFHTHMPYATALSMTEGDPLIWAGQTALKFYGRTAVDRDYNGLALDNREGARIASAVGDADIVFMKHHGVMVLAPTIAEAWDDLYYLERAAEVQVLAMSTGRKVLPVDPAIAAETYRQMRDGDSESARLHLAAIRRQLDAEEPQYRH